jgi:uncharacterized protein (DUF608 family)
MKSLGKFLLLFIFLLSLKTYSNQENYLKHYDKDHLLQVALPLGGIGTGTVSLGGRGELRDWEIMNIQGKGYHTIKMGNNAPFFAIYINDGEKNYTKGLLGPLDDSEYQDKEGQSVNHHGLPRFTSASFDATYPFGRVNLEDSKLPVSVKIKAFNPLVPADADASGIPIAILEYEVENKTSKELKVSVSGNMRNFVGKDGTRTYRTWKGDDEPTGAKHNQNRYKENSEVCGIYMYSDSINNKDAAWGTMMLSTPKNIGKITYRRSSTWNSWENAMLDFWDDFSVDGELTDKDKMYDHDPMASLAVKQVIPAKSKKTFKFYLTWHFPNRYAWGRLNKKNQWIGNYYTTKYENAFDVIDTEYKRLEPLKAKTWQFVNQVLKSPVEDVVKEAMLFNISTLRSQTVFRTPDGRMFGWEGSMDKTGSCQGTCTHVWNYEHTTAFLFGDLAKTMRNVEFEWSTNDIGKMSFRTNLPLDKKHAGGATAADGQMGTIMKFYRDWQLSGDDQFLKKHWPKVKLALSYCWVKDGWDRDKDGIMEGDQHNTMDCNYVGPNCQMQIWYLGALRAASEMAKYLGEDDFAKTCDELFKKGSEWTDKNLFNGEYYEQIVMSREHLKNITEGKAKGIKEIYIDNPKYPVYQIGKGCLIDQLVGQYTAHIVGLGYLVKPENVKKALNSVYKYNYKDGMNEHFNNMRSYALGNEKALLMASYPKGRRPKVPFPYFSEVMTGFEYTAAVGLLYEGEYDKGLDIIKNIRDRYNGSKRSPFDEAECGHHYARAMASWAAYLSLTDFQFSAIDKSMTLSGKDGSYFWSNGHAWGQCEVKGKNIKLSVYKGTLNLNNFILKTKGSKQLNNIKINENNSFSFDVQ